jgi:hypothetical protein
MAPTKYLTTYTEKLFIQLNGERIWTWPAQDTPEAQYISADRYQFTVTHCISWGQRQCTPVHNVGTYRVRQKYLKILQHSCEWNRWRKPFDLKHSSSDTQSISVAMERWSVEHRTFAVETYFKNNDSVLTQRIFRRHFNIHQNECP